jgi:hypothetical protein
MEAHFHLLVDADLNLIEIHKVGETSLATIIVLSESADNE